MTTNRREWQGERPGDDTAARPALRSRSCSTSRELQVSLTPDQAVEIASREKDEKRHSAIALFVVKIQLGKMQMSNQGTSLSGFMDAANNRPSGFDYMRLILSVLVAAIHSVGTAYGEERYVDWLFRYFPIDGMSMTVLPMFFVLSGFLVAGSMYRCTTLVSFLGLRFIRIYPALAVEVLISAFLLGPFVTSLSFSDYFADSQFWRYLLNVTGHITIYLPGVFPDNPRPEVANGQLWTVPFELECYVLLAVLMLFGAKYSSKVLLVGLALSVAVTIALLGNATGWQFTGWDGTVSGRILVVGFLVGVCLFAYRDMIPVSWLMIGVATVVAVVGFSIHGLGQYIGVFAIGYVTCALGVMNPPRIGLLRSGADLSYGIFLYHFGCQQLVMHLFPDLREWYWNLLLSLPLTVAVAAISWHFIERPFMERKSMIFKIEGAWVKRFPFIRRAQQSLANASSEG